MDILEGAFEWFPLKYIKISKITLRAGQDGHPLPILSLILTGLSNNIFF